MFEHTVIKMLKNYIKREHITQVDLAKRLGWSPQDLNDTLKGRKPIGKNRQAHIAKRLGFFFELTGGVLTDNTARHIKETKTPYGFDDDDLKIARLIKDLKKEQKEALKTVILAMQEKKE